MNFRLKVQGVKIITEIPEKLAGFFGDKNNYEKIAKIMQNNDMAEAKKELNDALKELKLPEEEWKRFYEFIEGYYLKARSQRMDFASEPCW